MTRKIIAVLLLSLTITACDSSLTDNNSNANSNASANKNNEVSSTPTSTPASTAPTPEPSVSVQPQLKAGDKVKVAINGSSTDATVVRVDEKLGKVTVKLEGQSEEKTVAIADVTHRALPH